jgi:hypothetical protein
VVAPPVTVVVAPPDALLQPCPPKHPGPYNTIRDLNTGRVVAENARDQCNADKTALRRWKAESLSATQAE